jgi:O-methyltransferase/methyltransferase family protein
MHMSAEQLFPERILQIGMGFESSKALLSAVELGVFTELAKKPMDVDALRQAIGIDGRSARDFFDVLVALGFLEREDGVYSNTPDADLYLDKGKPSYLHLGAHLEMANSRLYHIWGRLTECLKTGLPQSEATGGKSVFDAIYSDRDRLEQFLAAMTGISYPSNVRIAEVLPWKDHATVCDLGTAQGDLAVQIALAHPHITGFGFDLPQAQPVFEDYIKQNGLDDRLEFVGGDFFVDDLPPADVYTMGHILHSWNLDEKKQLIQKAYDALPTGGALVVFDAMIDDDRRTNVRGLLMSLNMATATAGGFDYTPADCIGWMTEIGYSSTRTQHLVRNDTMVVGVK